MGVGTGVGVGIAGAAAALAVAAAAPVPGLRSVYSSAPSSASVRAGAAPDRQPKARTAW
ncbi:hypothetical protein [Streptomyces pactum]|uniref:hypothetical protein n=1 Tax=Streptomyces pactum TaxID=68249 RepID=UPI00142D23F1|nr:hypothetical protein [Streptomyces pactum]